MVSVEPHLRRIISAEGFFPVATDSDTWYNNPYSYNINKSYIKKEKVYFQIYFGYKKNAGLYMLAQ